MNKGHLRDIPLALEAPVDSWASSQDQKLCSLVMGSSEVRSEVKSRKQGSRPSSVHSNFSGPVSPLSSGGISCPRYLAVS